VAQQANTPGVAYTFSNEPTPTPASVALQYAGIAYPKGWQMHPVTKQPISGG
jgi:hypothetical protein